MGTRLFVGNLSYNVTELELKEAFTSEGIEVRSVRVACERETGRPRGFAFVETATDDGAKQAIEKLGGHLVQGRALIIEEAQARPAPGAPRPGGPSGPPRFGGPRPPVGPQARVVEFLASRDPGLPPLPEPRGVSDRRVRLLLAVTAPLASPRAGANARRRNAQPGPSPRNANVATGAGRAFSTRIS
jgi:RNA recognition motif-containing protein